MPNVRPRSSFFLGFRFSHEDILLRNWKQLQLNSNFEKICDEQLSRDTEFETYLANWIGKGTNQLTFDADSRSICSDWPTQKGTLNTTAPWLICAFWIIFKLCICNYKLLWGSIKSLSLKIIMQIYMFNPLDLFNSLDTLLFNVYLQCIK